MKRQSSKESVISATHSTGSDTAAVPEDRAPLEEEEFIAASVDQSESPKLIHRNLSVTSSAGESKLGRIQLSLRYSVQRQKLIIVVHKIA